VKDSKVQASKLASETVSIRLVTFQLVFLLANEVGSLCTQRMHMFLMDTILDKNGNLLLKLLIVKVCSKPLVFDNRYMLLEGIYIS